MNTVKKEVEPDISRDTKVAEIATVLAGSPRGAALLRPRESRPEEHRRRICPPMGSWIKIRRRREIFRRLIKESGQGLFFGGYKKQGMDELHHQ